MDRGRSGCGSGSCARTRWTSPAGCSRTSSTSPGHCIALGHSVSVLAPADDERAGRRAAAAGVRHARRARDERALQRLRGPDHLRARLLRPRPALARRAHLRRAAPARARHVQPVVAGAVRGRRTDRRHVPHLHGAVPRDAWCSPGRSTRSWRRSRRGSRCPRWRGGSRSSTWAATRWRSRTASTCGCSPQRPAAARLPARRAHGRVPRPVRRAAQGHGGAARRAAPAGAAAGPDLRLLVVGRGDPDALRRDAGPELADAARHPRRGRRRDEGGGTALAWTSTARPTPAARASGWCSPRRWPPARRCWPATSARSARCCGDDGDGSPEGSGTAAGVLFPTGDARRARLGAGRAARRPAAPGRPRCRGSQARARRVRLAGGRRGRAAGLPGRHRRRPPPGARPDRGEHPVTAPNARHAGARAVAHGVGGRRRGAAARRGRDVDLRGPGPAAGPAAPADGRRPRRSRGRAGPARRGRAAGGRRAGRGPAGGRPPLAAVPRRRVRRSRRVPHGGCAEQASASTPCEVAENTLTRRLAAVDRRPLPAGLAAELADVEQSVLIARRVHNDAVRDTLDLRSRRLVRWLRLAGTAPAPVVLRDRRPAAVAAPAPRTARQPRRRGARRRRSPALLADVPSRGSDRRESTAWPRRWTEVNGRRRRPCRASQAGVRGPRSGPIREPRGNTVSLDQNPSTAERQIEPAAPSWAPRASSAGWPRCSRAA